MATRWGIVSAGQISNDFCSAIRTLPDTDHQIVAVATRSLASAQAFGQRHNIPKTYGSYLELALDANVQVVYIGSINTQHFALARMMLENGKHVLVEKPMTLNLNQTMELLEFAAEQQLFIMEALWSRFLPSTLFAMDQLHVKKAIGDVTHVAVTCGSNLDSFERVAKKELGGSTVLDLGVYCINAILMAFHNEKPSDIKAIGYLNDDGVDTTVSAVLKFTNGVSGSLTTHAKVNLPNEATITGTEGTLVIKKPMWCSEAVVVNGVQHDFPFSEQGPVKFNFGQNSLGLRYQANEVRNCLNEGLLESPAMSHAHSRLIASIEDELRHQVGCVFPED
ncbi:Trans-1,2-dihydrobenzene-1,2-diol dehydrogenase [Halotydeus destructor]|nr:Trans-1,2-dihydrobenzene-1,2-diol dehydrogenase [Halotydeus destructor]